MSRDNLEQGFTCYCGRQADVSIESHSGEIYQYCQMHFLDTMEFYDRWDRIGRVPKRKQRDRGQPK